MSTGSSEVFLRVVPDPALPAPSLPDPAAGLIDGVVDQTLHLRETMVRIADPFLLSLTDMLLFELGRRLARLEDE